MERDETTSEGSADAPGEAGGEPRAKGALHAGTSLRLREMILSGELPPGTRLRESHWCQVFEVSRTPFREAVRTLAAEGLIDLQPNRSPVVSQVRAEDLRDLYQVVAALESLAAELACARITADEIGQIVGIHGEMLESYERGERADYLRLNHLIHKRVIEIAGNPVLLSSWAVLVPKVERARALANLDRDRWLAAVSEHARMLSALARRDGPALASLTRAHFLNGLAFTEKLLEQGARY